jgi:cellobiose phosphorylase
MSNEDFLNHATHISDYHENITKGNSKRKIKKSLDNSFNTILRGYEYIDGEIKHKREVIPVAEWLMDNIYLIEKEYKDIKNNISDDYYKKLPVVKNGHYKGYPRIYHICFEITCEAENKIDEDKIINFIEEYQKHFVLNNNELWVLPKMLRAALIKSISDITEKIIEVQSEKRRADIIGDKLIDAVNNGTDDEELKKILSEDIKFTPHFSERILKILRDNGVDNKKIYEWIDNKLDVVSSNSENVIILEHKLQARLKILMGNCINSIREVEALNWRQCFEKLSYVEKILREDPVKIYENMDFASRDYYRYNIEKLARYMKLSEVYVAKMAIECAKEVGKNFKYECEKHVGYYIVDDGITCLKKKIKYREKGIHLLTKPFKNHNFFWYVSCNMLGTAALMAFIISMSLANDYDIVIWKYILAGFVVILPCSEIVNSVLNWSVNHLINNRFIPKMELQDGIPDGCKAIVVVPAILNNPERANKIIDELEIYYLANKEKNLYFALLGDFKDSKNQNESPNDENINNIALNHIKELNEKYKDQGEEIFYFFNRYRTYNNKQKMWFGWERKRGKLMEFNSLLRGNENTSYNVLSGNVKKLQDVKYVITLDADTQLPRDTAKKLIGAMDHVLNRAQLKESKISRGYGIMQPRVSISTVSSNKTLYSKIFSGETGIDTYSMAISDVYQDLFGEGIYTGKGIYDIDAFESTIEGKIKDNTVLSHDLLEGSYARCALISDVELIDGYPAYYDASCKRLHRWVRGDWQLLPYIFRNSGLNRLSKLKMIDNLRRSLLAPSIILLMILSLTVVPDGFEKWISLAFISLIFPWLFDVSEVVISPIRGISISGKMTNNKNLIVQIFLIFSLLTFNTALMIDAVFRTIYRISISKKNLLQWQTAEDAEENRLTKLKDYIIFMWQGSLIAFLIEVLAIIRGNTVAIVMAPSCILWFFSPVIAFLISKDKKPSMIKLSDEDRNLIRRISRKTFAYFEDFVNDEDNFLAPDNYQEDPPKGVAHRTSPTNMGMGITSNIVGYDLGYITIDEFMWRMDKIITSMESLEKCNGHFYNWYDTKSKIPLNPKYISTVDSGNLVGYFWLAAETLDDYMNKPLISGTYREGICDVLRIANEEIEKELSVKNYYNDAITQIEASKLDAEELKNNLSEVKEQCDKIKNNSTNALLYWNSKAKHQLEKRIEELEKIFPWADIASNRAEMIIGKAEKIKDLAYKIPFKDIPQEIDMIINTIRISDDAFNENITWLNNLKDLLTKSKSEVNRIIDNMNNLKLRISKMSDDTDFKIVFDKGRQLFSIGYDVDKGSLSNCYYDLLASESRQASFIAIASGEVEQTHWFKLGRAMTYMGKGKGLVSWSGTMFEYFMPLLIMRDYPDTLLDETYKSVVNGQRKYAKKRYIPIWGISESAFYSYDVAANYQYKAFGVPGIGLKRGLIDELVISPYSTILAMQKDLGNALNNLKKIIHNGLEGRYGLYEAIDYTKDRMPKGVKNVLVKCFMVHHQGMSLMALDNVLNSFILQNRFHNIPKVKATELLLQERIPKRVTYDREQSFEVAQARDERANFIVRHYNNPNGEVPETHLLSNGNYSVMISASGSGYGKLNDMTVYRWREDVTLDDTGMFFYIKDISKNKVWSATYEPTKNAGEDYEAIFALDKVEFKRKDYDIETHTEISVSSEDNTEVRTITLKNKGKDERIIEITSYSEITLAPMNADEVHPAFSNLFIRTEFIENPMCILANRRPRAKNQSKPWIMQTMVTDGEVIGDVQYETSRINFIGRGCNLTYPIAIEEDTELKNVVGDVIDPVISIRRKVKIKPGHSCKICYISSICESKEDAISMAQRYSEVQNVRRVFSMSWSESQVELKYLGIKPNQANLYQLMASKILFLNTMVRERADYIKSIEKSQNALWAYGISGDLPIVLLLVRSEADLGMVRQLLNAHEYWAMKGLKVDLLIMNMEESSYLQDLSNSLREVIASGHSRDKENKSGGVFLYGKATMNEEDRNLILAIARLVIDSAKGLLVSQVKSSIKLKNSMPMLEPKKINYEVKDFKFPQRKLKYYNGYGGFDVGSDDYVIRLKDKQNTPAPWVNVISNKNFGFHVSELGSAYTWCKNSRENKLTPWSNDYVTDRLGEALYIRDEDTAEIWSISPKPIRDDGEYIIEHGKGYSTFRHMAKGIIGDMTMFVPMNDNVKIIRVKLKNISNTKRNISLTYYSQLVLGVVPRETVNHIVTYIDEDNKFMYANNPYNSNFGRVFAYLKIQGGNEESFSGDRKEFIGRGGSIEKPIAMDKKALSNNIGAGLDPCMVENAKIVLLENEEKIINIILGEGESIEEIEKVLGKYSNEHKITNELEKTREYWKEMLGKIKVKTPDETMDIMLNGQLMYQAIACRLWARSAFYQSGGAYGFRDQLQDVMPLCFIKPEMTREQILINASRQFIEGDVQHWWHPVVDSGIRTRFSDDLLWLPYVVSDYIKNTGDYSILEEEVSYIEDEPLKEGEDERYNVAKKSDKFGSIYEHCIKALEKGLKFGVHNIPLMGSGDWNDGMSTVGNKGKGESVWLGWFLYSILKDFKDICKYKEDEYRSQRYSELSDFVSENIEKNAWDGNWYRRAYFDDGTPLGSSKNDECKIDSLAQSWAVISKAGNVSRAKIAMKSLEKYLVKEDKKMVLLLSPPFNNSKLEPGYIKGYIPGVRENGGQYTHAATWVILAMAKLNESNKAWKLFNMINPINHTKTMEETKTYKVEPYVMAADVYAEESNMGRGGWTWYTGTAGWMYRVGIEGILGLKLSGGKGFEIHPCVPEDWNEYEMYYTHEKCKYKIKVERGSEKGVTLDGKQLKTDLIPFLKDGEHLVEVTI